MKCKYCLDMCLTEVCPECKVDRRVCKLCGGTGQVKSPHGCYESGFWEDCPLCSPFEEDKTNDKPFPLGLILLWLVCVIGFFILLWTFI